MYAHFDVHREQSDAAATVLVVEDGLNVNAACKQALQLAGIKAVAATSVQSARMILGPHFSGVILMSMRAHGIEGLQLQDFVRRLGADLPVVLIAGEGEEPLAVEAVRCSAYDVIETPFSSARLIEAVRRALEKRRLTVELETLRRRLRRGCEIEARLIGSSPQMETVRQRILDLAESGSDALVIGERGTGKDLAARCIYDFSPGERGNFVALDCRGLPEAALDQQLFDLAPEMGSGRERRRSGPIECAVRGTLFLDHVDALPAGIQAKLLATLADRATGGPGSDEHVPPSLRIIIGGAGDLMRQVADGRFGVELCNRFAATTIALPSLKERRQDIPVLYDHFLLMAAKRHGAAAPACSPDEVCALLGSDWPGNVSELRNHADRRALGMTNGAGGADAAHRDVLRLSEAVETFERTLIAAELGRNAGNISRTSEALGVARTTLHDKMRKYGLSVASA
jgi:DNA-binding NtrC family response regulator